ncbi:MAG: exodeoxyribonuclease VII small subunit [candidate division Zixibacteria bacterium]|nr:exodeoxyribonuclease VII small subunit [candidate division Zixibacteria bacterium]
MTASAKQYKDFESALERLEDITNELESGEAKLEKSIALYTEGIEIAAFCSKKLTEAEKKIAILRENNDRLIEESFADGDDDDEN